MKNNSLSWTRVSTTRTRLGRSLALPVITVFVLCANNFAQDDRLTPQEALRSLDVVDGLEVTTFAADPNIVSISNIDVDHRGRVWACECVNYRGNNGKRPAGDRILILEDADGDGQCDKTTVFYQGRDIDIAMGLCVLGNKAIVSVAPEILLLEDTDGDDRADKKTVLFTSDAVFQHDHSLHSFVFGPDGRFYANFGNTGHQLKDADGRTILDRRGNEIVDDGKPYHGGMVFRCDRDFGKLEVLAHNFRNNYEATVDSFGGVWQSDNDDDGNLAVRLNYILEGGNYGYLDELTGERWQQARIGAHPYRGKRHWHQNDPGSVPNVLETGNGAPTGITIYEGRLLPKQLWDQVIHCDAGPHVVWGLPVTQRGAGFTSTKADIIRSPDNNFRPVDAAVAPDGSLFVSDWYDPVVGGFKQDDIERGRIYWVAPKGHKYTRPRYDFDSAEGAVDALRSPNYCARYLAWMRLHEMGFAAETQITSLLADPNPRLRARALWLLGQIPGREATYITRAIGDYHAEVRVVGLRLTDLLKRDVVGLIQQLADDPSPRVRAEAAVLLRHHSSPRAAEVWAALAAKHNGKDRWYLEALGIGADQKWDACLAQYRKLRTDQSRQAIRDIVWRSRGTTTPNDLAQILLAPDGKEDPRRYVRAFDFQSSDQKDEALTSVAFAEGVPPVIALATLGRIAPEKLRADARGRGRLLELLAECELDLTAIELIQQHKLTELSSRLLLFAQREDNELKVDAIRALLDLEQVVVIARALNGKDREAATATARALAKTYHSGATNLLLPFIIDSSFDAEARKSTACDLVTSVSGAQALLTLVENNRLPQDVQQAIAVPILTHRNEDVRTRAERLITISPAKDARPLPKLRDLAEMQGNPVVGQQVFVKQGKCAACHQVRGEGKAIGPDLSQIGTKLARPAMYEAILYPSAAISHNYESYTAVLESGQVATGILVNESDMQIQLRDAEGILRTLNRTEVEDFQRQSVSLMPANSHEAITAQELVDLVAFLATLKLEAGFVSMFDGKTLSGWTCAPLAHSEDWWAEDGKLVGMSDSRGSYLAWTGGGELRNFEVRLSYQILSPRANTGLQVRSKFFPDDWPYPLKGYQADIGHVGIGPRVLGGWDFHGTPRGDILVERGYRVTIAEDGTKTHTALEGAIAKKEIQVGDWNEVRVVAQDETMTFYINGNIASEVIDHEKSKRVDRGYLGLQLHQGDSMRIEFRNLRVRAESL
jgi:putative membrane-bound dehydrogenase-like protein